MTLNKMINEEEIKVSGIRRQRKMGSLMFICIICLEQMSYRFSAYGYKGTARTTTCVQGTPFTDTRG